jgi:hydrogenase maturation protease
LIVSEHRVLIVGVGNEWRGDDAAGIEVARRVRSAAGYAGVGVHEQQGELSGLVDHWHGVDGVVLVDTMRSRLPAGAVRRFDASRTPLPAAMNSSMSTHAFGLSETIELARTLNRLPARVIVYAIQADRFEAGAGFSRPLTATLPALAEAVLGEARELAAQGA